MVQVIFIGIAAGVAAALLFIAPLSGGALAFPLFTLTGLPIAIAGLGWGVLSGAIAAIAAAGVVLVIFPVLMPAAVLLGLFAVPMVWLSRLAGLWRDDNADGVREWYPLARLLLHTTLAIAVGIVVVATIAGYDPAIISADATIALTEFFAQAAVTSATPPPTAEALAPFVQMYVSFLPFTIAVFLVGITVLVLWLAAIIARSSGRFPRPAERLWTVGLPNEILIGFGIAVVLAFVLPSPLGSIAGVFAGAFACALALVGLAVLHALTLGMSGRPFVLGITYALIVISGLPLILLAIIGGAENFLHLRARRFRGALPPT